MKLPIKEYLQLLGKYLKGQKRNVVFLVIIILLNVGLQLVNPQIIRYFIDEVQKGNGGKNLIIAACLFIGLAFVKQGFNIIATYISQTVGWNATNALRLDLIEHCINLDIAFHKNHQPGELIERVDGDVNQLFNFFSTFTIKLLTNVGLLLGVLVLLSKEDLRVGGTLLFMSMIAMIVLGYIEKTSSKYWEAEREFSGKFFGFLGEQVTSTEDIKACGARQYVMNKFYGFLRKLLKLDLKATMAYYHMWIANLVLFGLVDVVLFFICAKLFKSSTITIGTIYLIFYYKDLLREPLEEIRGQLQDLQKSEASIKRVSDLFNTKSSIIHGEGVIKEKIGVDIDLKDVSFRYEDGDMVINNLSLKIPKNKILGVLGHTGSGKTTLARLMVRLYDISEGELLIGGKDIKTIKNNNLRDRIAYVTQEVQIFNATVRENLTLFNNNIKEEDIMKAITEVGLGDWLSKLPSGLETVLDGGGSGLSAGEAQLLAFVRVFLKNPSIVILDEATSRLDPITEQLIEKALDKLVKNRTCIIIAHRLQTVQRADEILILEHGALIEHGERDILEKDKNSKFYDLLQKGLEEVLV